MQPERIPRPPWRIAVVSATVLILELALIRQIPAEVRAISYFTNLLLMASFFGLGLGCILSRKRFLAVTIPLGLALTATYVYFFRGLVVYEEAEAVHYWLQYEAPRESVPSLPLFPSALVAFVICALPFAGLGRMLAKTMDEHPRLVAYAWDIVGSLGGTLLFVACSFWGVPPWIWPPLLMLVWAVVFGSSWPSRVLHVGAGALFLVFAASPFPSAWSPYYLIQHQEEALGTKVWVNSSFHQYALNFDAESEEASEFLAEVEEKFSLPYDVYRSFHEDRSPNRVLILGAGTGNDVNIAKQNGAEDIVAVEIDPIILELGFTINPTRPYDDDNVRTVTDDARHYLRTSDEQFDLIIFGTLDSETLLSGHTNLRLENYVYTLEAFEDAKARLVDGGMVATYYSVQKDWLFSRLYATVCPAFGEHCQIHTFDHPFLFNTVLIGGVGLDDFLFDPSSTVNLSHFELASTDDWPFLYMEYATISPVYLKLLVAVLVLICLALVVLRRTHSATGLHTNFFFLGAGFTLLESAAIVRLSLLFGNTWFINAVVFASALGTIFLANLAVMRRWAPRPTLAWGGLLAAIALNFALPPAILLNLPFLARIAACAVLVGGPVFFAGVCFSRLFERQKSTGYALGINLIGAMAGGWLEYLSMITGMRAIWMILVGVYLSAWLATRIIDSRERQREGVGHPGSDLKSVR